ncbi:hypothetical protein NUU61_004840 [Penicillium alfredii]|uniref:Protein kinase domain-containing protein n=1 Tax=Penicillium alfredii TaxID=1506179 RepID=A0A9W9F8E3_9EURO|nr:uncharacterized protein NUU61_004840 [Penicillium alfredii]KAJ5095484.1 hypothetical protein NUU61_004840 [Penicillium alfredii]
MLLRYYTCLWAVLIPIAPAAPFSNPKATQFLSPVNQHNAIHPLHQLDSRQWFGSSEHSGKKIGRGKYEFGKKYQNVLQLRSQMDVRGNHDIFDASLDNKLTNKRTPRVAVKTSDSQEMINRAKLVDLVDPVYVVKPIDYFKVQSQYFMIMPYLDQTFRDYIYCHGRGGSRVVLFLGQLIEGLAAMHRRGVKHRDIKLDNAMLDGDRAKWIDFDESTKDPTSTQRIGTPGYIPPEQMEGLSYDALMGLNPFASHTLDDPNTLHSRVSTSAGDIYSIGMMILYSLLVPDTYLWFWEASAKWDTRQTAFNKLAKNEDLAGEGSRKLKEVIAGCICSKPTDRWTVDELSAQFQATREYRDAVGSR